MAVLAQAPVNPPADQPSFRLHVGGQLGLPILLAGVRIAIVTTIGLATVTAWINAGGLGTLLFDGIARDYPSEILAGTIAITALSLLMDMALRLIERATPTARALRHAR